jgi:hypothetical protein
MSILHCNDHFGKAARINRDRCARCKPLPAAEVSF